MIIPAQAEFPRMLPATESVSRTITVVDWEGQDRATDLAVRSLQGLVNRHSPSIWVGQEKSPGRSGWWLNRIVAYGYVQKATSTLTAIQFLQTYKQYAKGIVIPPTDLGPEAYHVAVARAAVEDLIIGTDELAESLGLPIVEDYRGQFKSLAETFESVFNQFIKTHRLNLEAAIFQRGDLAGEIRMLDYAIQQRLFTFTWHEGNYPEMWALEEILNFMPDNIPILGAVGGGRGFSSEGEVIMLISRYGKFSLGSSAADNLSVHTGLPHPTREAFRQKRRVPPEYDPNKVYVCVHISDGDNANIWRYHLLQRGLWQKRGRIPIGWTMAGGLKDLMPVAARYYYDEATPMDEFFQGLSGLGYTFPGEYALGERDQGPPFSKERKEAAWNDYLYRAGATMDFMDFRLTTTHHFKNFGSGLLGDEEWRRYANQLPGCWGILNGYNKVANLYGENDRIVEGMPIIHTAIDRNSGEPGSLVSDIAAAAGTERPAFVQVFWVPFGLDYEWGVKELASLPPDTELVLPSEFAAFYRQAHKLPTPKPWPVWVTPTPSPTGQPTPTPRATPTPTPAGESIELVNPGFETGDLTGWSLHYNDPDFHVTQAEYAIFPYEGRWIFGATFSNRGEGNRELIYQKVRVKRGDTLLLTAFLRTRTIGGPEENSRVRLAFDPSGGTDFQYSEYYSGNHWRPRTVQFRAAKSTVTIGIELSQNQSLEWNHYYCDLVSLIRLNATPTPAVER